MPRKEKKSAKQSDAAAKRRRVGTPTEWGPAASPDAGSSSGIEHSTCQRGADEEPDAEPPLAGNSVDPSTPRRSPRIQAALEKGRPVPERDSAAPTPSKLPLPKDMVLKDASTLRWKLPEGWHYAEKKTESGGTRRCFLDPDMQIYWDASHAQAAIGRQVEPAASGSKTYPHSPDKLQSPKPRVQQAEVKLPEVKYDKRDEEKLFALLDAAERKCLVEPQDLHFAIISARRAEEQESKADALKVEACFRSAGVRPRWYVDEASYFAYCRLGLDAEVGGGLTASRNAALADATRRNMPCVQCSDDVSKWEYLAGDDAKHKTDAASNKAMQKSKKYSVSPVAAARFILAKMRWWNTQGWVKPQLGGTFCVSGGARAFRQEAFTTEHFILGDFFVVDKSRLRFDTNFTLKEDYDFTCQHIREHGGVLRCNRFRLQVKHNTNPGGACTIRDEDGQEEDKNIRLLDAKWPGTFRRDPIRNHQVRLHWDKANKVLNSAESDGEDLD
eukprot:gnl/TRDRNA2_/TRDRNA2_42488_c0_seq1.p1 gnl/TRDRNA2_/TRDRNA2_42488_c0~~gnl/TRDRNA2_/TRDRNA2_42488_c0_seq1.p1  ORF type:complete len:500 (+),score=84.30 gnl/TRDRNA2_/TRDRNA2_42488_c0_seq1:46-1545(+)